MTKPQLNASLKTWAQKQKRINKINADADRALQPHLEAYEKKTAAITTERDEKLQPLITDLEKLEAEIRAALLSQIKADGTAPAPAETEDAVAQVTVDRKREIDPATFMRAVPPRMRQDPGFMQCLSVLIGKAEKFVDKPTLARIVRPKLTHGVAITLKPE